MLDSVMAQLNDLIENLNLEGLNESLPYIGAIGAGAAVVVGLYCCSNAQVTNLDKLIAAIKAENVELAKQYINAMTLEELNSRDKTNHTPLLYALNSKTSQIAKALIDKFLAGKHSLDIRMANGGSLLKNKRKATKLLSLITAPYKNYACSDVKRFAGNINHEVDNQTRESIMTRVSKNVTAETEANMIQPYLGNFSRKQISRCAQLVDEAQSAACTGFALSVAEKLLILFPNERLQIISHQGGYAGTHVFVALNNQGEVWDINQLQDLHKAGKLESEEGEKVMSQAIENFKETYIIDTWLASLGWGNGVFDFEKYLLTPKISHFLYSGSCSYDSKLSETAPQNHRTVIYK